MRPPCERSPHLFATSQLDEQCAAFLSFTFLFLQNFTQAVKREEGISEIHSFGGCHIDPINCLVRSSWVGSISFKWSLPNGRRRNIHMYVAGISRRRMGAEISNFSRRLRRNQPDNHQLLHIVRIACHPLGETGHYSGRKILLYVD